MNRNIITIKKTIKLRFVGPLIIIYCFSDWQIGVISVPNWEIKKSWGGFERFSHFSHYNKVDKKVAMNLIKQLNFDTITDPHLILSLVAPIHLKRPSPTTFFYFCFLSLPPISLYIYSLYFLPLFVLCKIPTPYQQPKKKKQKKNKIIIISFFLFTIEYCKDGIERPGGGADGS